MRGEACPPKVSGRATLVADPPHGVGDRTRCRIDLSTVTGDRTAKVPQAFAGRRWLLPSAVADELDPDVERRGRPRRTARDWVVDTCCFLLAVGIGLAAAQTLDSDSATPHSLAVVDQFFGVLACGAVWLRRRWPVGLAVAMIPVGFVSNTAGGAAMVAVFTLAVHRPFRYVAWVGGVQLALAPLFFWLRPDPDLPYGRRGRVHRAAHPHRHRLGHVRPLQAAAHAQPA